MKTYLLLRNNRQSGPHSLEELLALGLKAQDLIWVDGYSASWRYPAEFDEFRALVAPPVGEAVLVNEFTDAQNRILEAYPAESEQPVHRDIPPVFQQPLRPLDFHGGVSIEVARESEPTFELGQLPAFQAFGSMLDDEEMPTIALYQPLKAFSSVDIPLSDLPSNGSDHAAEGTPVHPADKPRIRVSLPAALADKTLVVIQRRDEAGRVVVPPRSKPRRPVIEFLPDEQQTAEPALQVATNHIPEIPEDDKPLPEPLENAGTGAPVQPELFGTTSLPIASQPEVAAIASPQWEAPSEASEIFQPQQGLNPDLPVTDAEPENIYAVGLGDTSQSTPPVGTLQVNIALVQKVAVAAAIISLIVVAGLIANAVFNPRAYDYSNPRPSQKSASSMQPRESVPSATSGISVDTVLQQSTVSK